MNCTHVKTKLSLHAGGDLLPGEASEVEEHLEQCAECCGLLETYRQTLAVVHDYVEHDLPAGLPDDFAADILHKAIGADKTTIMPHIPSWQTALYRYGIAACLVAAIGMFLFRVSGDMTHYRMRVVDAQRAMVKALVSSDRSQVSAKRLERLSVSGPWRLDEWEPSGNAGIYAILHKPDPENHPDEFSVDYLGEANRIDYKGDLWRRQRINRLTERTGSEENIYIAEYPMPQRSVKERRAVLNTLKDTLRPYYN